MRIIHVLEKFFPESKAGTEHYVYNLSKQLKDRGHEVYIICTNLESFKSYNYKNIEIYSLHIEELADKNELTGLRMPKNISSYLEILLLLNPDIVHFHTFNRTINYFHLIETKKAGYKTVFTSHLAWIFCLKGSLLLFDKKSCNGKVNKFRCFSCFLYNKGVPKIIALTLSCFTLLPKNIKEWIPVLSIVDYRNKELVALNLYCDAIISLSPWVKNSYDLNGVRKTKLVIQGTEMLVEEKVSVKKNKISIGFIGRMYPIKGLHLLLDALNSMNNSSFILKIIYLPDNENYLTQIKEKAATLYNPCVMISNQSSEQVERHLKQIDVLCLPSLVAEMAPLVILEAFSKGIPVIGSNHGGIKDMIKNNINGLLFENNNISSLCRCLQSLVENPDLLEKLHSNILPPSSFDKVAEEMVSIYNQII